MNAVTREKNQDDKVGDQQREIEGVGLVNALESLIEKVRLEILPDAARTEE